MGCGQSVDGKPYQSSNSETSIPSQNKPKNSSNEQSSAKGSENTSRVGNTNPPASPEYTSKLKTGSMYKSRVMDHNTEEAPAKLENGQAPEDVEVEDDELSKQEEGDKVAPLPTKFNNVRSTQQTTSFHPETDGVQWSNLYVNAGAFFTSLFFISYLLIAIFIVNTFIKFR
jgi:hypothetical protein